MSAMLELIKAFNSLGSNFRVVRTQRPRGEAASDMATHHPELPLSIRTAQESQLAVMSKGDEDPADSAAWCGTSGAKQARGRGRWHELLEPDSACACGQQLSLPCHFQKKNLVITIKRPYYIADFLEKSVFYWAGPQTHTHPVSHNTLK